MTRPAMTIWRTTPGRLLGAAACLLAVQWIHAVAQVGGTSVADFFGNWVYAAIVLLAGAACVAGTTGSQSSRAAWTILGIGLLSFGVGDVIYATAPRPDAVPVPSISDPFWLAFYPCAYLALLLLARRRAADTLAATRLDGVISGVTAASVLACITLPAAFSSSAGAPFWEQATDLAYPAGDLVLFGAVISSIALAGWRLDRPLAILGVAVIAWEVADVIYMFGVRGRWSDMTDALVLTGVVAMALAATTDRRRPVPVASGDRGLFVPVGFGAAALVVLSVGVILGLNVVGLLLAAAALGVVLLRMALALGENRALLGESQVQASTDQLTRLGNRRKLKQDLARVLDTGVRSTYMLVLLDLNGFKAYNDSFGHAAGDALLAQLGGALAGAVRPYGEAYRLGGDEFCVIAASSDDALDELPPIFARALATRGKGFSISAAYGAALLPAEARDVSAALALADARMYSNKASGGRGPAADQPARVLTAVVEEHAPTLAAHQRTVQSLALATAAELGLSDEEREALSHAAALYDLGMMAIPESILHKPGPLSDDEWELVRRHPLVGERILATATALKSSALLVRHSHERVDGRGYPDGLAGEQIPIGARIIAVADAYEAMLSPRPYRPPRSPLEALEELRRCAGTQFDRVVVVAFEHAAMREPSAGERHGTAAPG
ncbi:MAG TPA: HD domain-containing phosphohydrolase [Solirubrobacteraceae bacterium]|nr:HD domain-containing phosphohydrolase [Solirubrobacteraceae bacterium]